MTHRHLAGMTLGLALTAGLVAAPAVLAHGPRRAPLGGLPGLPPATPAAAAKDPTCLRLCADAASLCTAAALADQRTCRTGTCGPALAAARNACAADPAGRSCAEARDAAVTCLGRCMEAFTTAMGGCSAERRNCVTLCPDAGAQPRPDPACLARCRSDLQQCLRGERTAGLVCLDSCRTLVETARAACTAGDGSEACQQARQAARTCVQPCYEAFGVGHAACKQAHTACVRGCPPGATPTPAPAGTGNGS